ncbi:PREDICTED: collagen alpha-1(I) chain-like [Chinchilla lanigera]|uniref:collagen alpha-1(I) chain-like n=1 Tax=Chinchilla lanigera TaxID=34839 RepID=UPI000698602F|nr:PREDICTED: collagen alpha-1(I) chain-like [Chinchilla lanigera]
MARSVNKSEPHAGPRPGAEQQQTSSAGFRFQCPLPGPPRVPSPGYPLQALQPGRPARSAARMAKVSAPPLCRKARPVSARDSPEMHTQTHARRARALPEVDLKIRRQMHSDASAAGQRRPPGDAWALSSGAGHQGPAHSPPPGHSSSRGILLVPSSPRSPIPKCVRTKTIRREPDQGELGPAGSPRVRETGSGRARHGRTAPGIPSPSLGAARPGPARPAGLTWDVRPGSPGPRRAQCGIAGPLGLRAPKRSPRCRAARPTAAAQICPAALRAAPPQPMGAVTAPPPEALGAEPREPVGNQAPIGSPDNRSASDQPIRDGGDGSGAFGVGLESHNSRTPGSRAASRPASAARRRLAPRAPQDALRLRGRSLERRRVRQAACQLSEAEVANDVRRRSRSWRARAVRRRWDWSEAKASPAAGGGERAEAAGAGASYLPHVVGWSPAAGSEGPREVFKREKKESQRGPSAWMPGEVRGAREDPVPSLRGARVPPGPELALARRTPDTPGAAEAGLERAASDGEDCSPGFSPPSPSPGQRGWQGTGPRGSRALQGS